jgi:hypothetical protein
MDFKTRPQRPSPKNYGAPHHAQQPSMAQAERPHPQPAQQYAPSAKQQPAAYQQDPAPYQSYDASPDPQYPQQATHTTLLKDGLLTRFLRNLYYTVWILVGISLLILAGIGYSGEGTWVQNLNLADTSKPLEVTRTDQQQTATQQPQLPVSDGSQPQPQQQTETFNPDPAQAACIIAEVGDERYAELENGAALTAEEEATARQCLEV